MKRLLPVLCLFAMWVAPANGEQFDGTWTGKTTATETASTYLVGPLYITECNGCERVCAFDQNETINIHIKNSEVNIRLVSPSYGTIEFQTKLDNQNAFRTPLTKWSSWGSYKTVSSISGEIEGKVLKGFYLVELSHDGVRSAMCWGDFKLTRKPSPTVTAKKKTTYNPEHLKRLKDTNKCPNCDLQDANLWDANLQGADLQDANLKNANLFNANLFNANLQRADLKGASLVGASFVGANLRDANLQGANLKGANLKNANVQGAKLDSEGVDQAEASGAINVPGTVTAKKLPSNGSSLPPCPTGLFHKSRTDCFGTLSYPGGKIKYVGEWKNGKKHGQGTLTFANGNKYVGEWKDDKLWNGQGTYTNADGRVETDKMENGNYLYAKKPSPTVTAKKTTTYNPEHLKRLKEKNTCPNCDLRGANLKGANLFGANLKGANLFGANLQEANLRRANLRRADLQGANLLGASLIGTNLYNANLYGANLKDAKVDAEDLAFAKASGAINVPEPVVVAKKTPKVTPKRKPKPPVVAKVTPKKTTLKPPTQSISASGFFVSKLGHVITNEHVVRNCKSVTVGDNAIKQSPASVEVTDKRNDLALLKLSTLTMASAETKSLIAKLGIRVVPLASDGLLRSEDVELGERVMVSGYPYGDIFSNTIKVTSGIVSAVRGMGDDSSQFTMDAAVQKGSSGGPIYDENGNVVGVVVAKLDRAKVAKRIGSMPENMNFGIKASTVRQFLTSSGLPTKWSKRSKSMSTKELAKIAKKQTLMVVCHQ